MCRRAVRIKSLTLFWADTIYIMSICKRKSMLSLFTYTLLHVKAKGLMEILNSTLTDKSFWNPFLTTFKYVKCLTKHICLRVYPSRSMLCVPRKHPVVISISALDWNSFCTSNLEIVKPGMSRCWKTGLFTRSTSPWTFEAQAYQTRLR